MARRALGCLSLCVLGAAREQCALDGLALHQQALRVHALAEEGAAAPARTTPDKAMIAKVRPFIKESADGLFRRTTAKLKLPTIPAMFRWELVGKATSFAVSQYQKPKTPAFLGLLDELIELAADVLGSKDIATMDDAQLAAQLGNLTRLHAMAQHYIAQAGAPPAVGKLVDAMAESAKSKGSLDPSTAAVLIVDAANETCGRPMAELLQYEFVVASGNFKFEPAHWLELNIPVMAQFGAPPAVGEYLQKLADNENLHLPHDQMQDTAAAQRMFATASRQLGMPSALPEMLDYVADVTGNVSETHIFEKPAEMAKMADDLSVLAAKLSEQLGAPPAVAALVRRLGRNQSAPSEADISEIFGLLSQASQQLSFPSAVGEFFDYIAPIVIKKGAAPVDPERLQELLLKLTEQLGAPEAFNKFGKDISAMATKNGGQLDPAKLPKLVSQLLRKLGMPAFADIFGKLAVPILKGKQPDPLSLAAVAPSFMKVMPDFETANGLASDMHAKLMKPLVPFFENAVQKLTGNMPSSGLKNLLLYFLALSKPVSDVSVMN